MSPKIEQSILEHLVAIEETLDLHSEDFREINDRLGKLGTNFAGLVAKCDGIAERLERIDVRLADIEARI